MSRLLGLDHGLARVGVALSDEGRMLATPLVTLDARRLQPLLHQLQKIIHQHQVQEIVLGLPCNADGSEGPQAEKVRKFARHLQSLETPIHFQNEHLSSHEAMQRGATRQNVDRIAAALILQAYLDRKQNPPPS